MAVLAVLSIWLLSLVAIGIAHEMTIRRRERAEQRAWFWIATHDHSQCEGDIQEALKSWAE